MAKIVLRAGKVAVKVTLPIMIMAVLLYSVKLLTPIKAEETNPGGDMVGSTLEVPQDVNWNNAGGNMLWRNAANWNGGVPTAADKAAIRDMLVSGPIIDVSATAVAFQIVVSDWSSFGDTLDITGGTLTTVDWFIIGCSAGNDGTFNVSGGTTSVGGHMFVGFMGAGHINMTGGSITVSGTLGIAWNTGSTGNVFLDGGTISCNVFSMQAGATMDIGGGTLIVNGDATSTINGYIDSGWLTAYDGSGTLDVDYDITNPGETTVTASSGEKACYPDPANGATSVSVNADLSWTAGAYAVSHDVYFGTDPTPDETEFMGNQTEITFEAGTMDPASTYYWRVDEKNALGTTVGDIWSFTTQTRAAEKMEQLWAQYSTDERFVERVKRFADKYADKYLLVGEYEKALVVYEYVLDNWTDSNDETWAKAGVIKAHIGLGDDPNGVQLDIETLFTDHYEHPDLTHVVFTIAKQYYNQAFQHENQGHNEQAGACFRNAITIWERVMEELPPSPTEWVDPETYHLSADCYRRLGQFEEALQYYLTVVVNWPEYAYTWQVKFLIGDCYERLKQAGTIPKSEANFAARLAYEQLLRDHPVCPAAKAARNRLAGLAESGEGEQI